MKRRSKNRRRKNSSKLDFQKLEARELLAGDVIAGHQAEGLLPTGTNIVVNGDFASVTAGSDQFFTEAEVPGWNAFDAATGQEINIFEWKIDGYRNVLDIDSTTTDFDRVYQDLNTEAETEYLVAFDYRNHPVANADATEFTHDFEVWWNNELVGRFTGGDSWTTGIIKVTSSNLDVTRLLFCEISEVGAPEGDGQGALLDNIRVVKASEVQTTNGGFETTAEEKSVFFAPADVPGWSAMATDVADRLLKVQTVDSAEGSQHLNLDSTDTNRDIIFTDLQTEAGSSYYVTFDMKNDGDQTTNPDELRVRWNGEWATTIFGTSEWETYGLMLTADSAETRLTFLEPGETTGDGSGPLLDNIQLFKITEAAGSDGLAIDINGEADGVDGSETFVPGAGAQPIGQNISLNSTADLDSVVVTLSDVVDGANEILSISPSSIPTDGSGNDKISVTSYSNATKTLTLSGAATAAEYQAVLRTLTYFNASDSFGTTNRTVGITTSTEASIASANIDLAFETDQTVIDDAILTKFAADNNLTTTDLGNGLYAVIDEPGTGQNPTINDRVRVNYNGKFITLNNQNKLVEGESFDLSSSEGITFPLTGVIEGWQIGIPAFKTGGTGQLLIPSHLAYGTTGQGSIPPNTVLLFDIELLEIIAS